MQKNDGATATFGYDLNGNLVQGDGRSIGFDELDRPVRVTQGGVTTDFYYAPDGSRYLRRVSGGGAPARTEYYLEKDYELVVWDSGQSEERTYVGEAVVIGRSNGGVPEARYRHLDRLGSLDAVTGAGALELEGHGFDAFGKPRQRDWQTGDDKLHGYATERGFTQHEHLDDHYLVHMNGRVYDYRLGRFLSVDPIISNPANSQSINPYSYIGNNPLSGTDPTGYDACPGGGKGTSDGCPAPVTGTHIPGTLPAGSNLTFNGLDAGVAFHQWQDATTALLSGGTTTSGQDAAKGGNGGGSNAGTTPNNTNPGTEGSPAQPAQKEKGFFATVADKVAGWWREQNRLEQEQRERWEKQERDRIRQDIRDGRIKVDSNGDMYRYVAGLGEPIGRVVGPELDPAETPIFRGGDALKAELRDIKLNRDGTMKPYGVSLNTDAAKLEARLGSYRQIRSVPEELKIVQTGRDPGHYEIISRVPNSMTPERYQQLLNQVQRY